MEFDVERARAIVVRCCNRKRRLFDEFPHMGLEDLIQIGMIRAMQVHAAFDPARARYVTWIYRAVSYAIIDAWRACRRRAGTEDQRHEAAMIDWWEEPEDDTPVNLLEWLRETFLRAKRANPEPREPRRGRKWFSIPQAVTIGLLMQRLRLSSRGARELLIERPDLAQVLRLRHVPTHDTFWRMSCFLSEITEKAQRRRKKSRTDGHALLSSTVLK